MTEQHAAPTGKHVLVINDTEEILDLFRSILEDLGHRTTAWSFSPDDLAKVTEIMPELIILDLLMGPTELQGWALLQKLRMSPPTEAIPVVVCSAATNWVREQEGWLAANGVKVVLKPFRVADLERAVAQAFTLPELMAKPPTAEDTGTGPAPTGPDESKERGAKPH